MKRDNPRRVRLFWAILLVVVIVAGLLGRRALRVDAVPNDLYGFSLEEPDGFDAQDGRNPYGQGAFALSPKSEVLIWRQDHAGMSARAYNFDSQADLAGKKLTSGTVAATATTGSKGANRYVSTVGYDPTGEGRPTGLAMVGLEDADDDEMGLYVARYNAKGGFVRGRRFAYLESDDDDDSDWMHSIPQWAYSAYFVVTAGDYDGNGTDELAVYFMARRNPRILVLDGQSLATLREIPLRSLVGAVGADLSSKFDRDGRTARATVQVSMDSSDIDRDGKDDLLVVASYADIHDDSDGEKLTERSSVLGFYRSAATNWSQRWVLDKDATGTNMRTSSVAAGDLDNDGFDEVVVAGYYSKNGADGSDGDTLTKDRFCIAMLDWAFTDDAMTQGELRLGAAGTVEMNEFTEDGFYSDDEMHGTPALTCFRARGRNAAEELFLMGTCYRWTGNGWEETDTADHCTESDNGIGSYIISNTWVDQCVAGNFDANELGAEQVVFTSGYKQLSVESYFYRTTLMGYGTQMQGDYLVSTDFYQCDNDQVVNHIGRGDRPACSVAVVDVDDDTDLYRYQRKSFTYSNAKVMALLQAPPFFEDLKNDYYALVGATCYGEMTGSGSSTIVTSAAHAGFFFTLEVETPVVQFSSEASYVHEWLWEDEHSLSQEFTWTLENHSHDNAVALYRTPVIIYEYEVTPAGGGAPHTMTLGIPEEPSYLIMDAKRFNEIAKNDPAMAGIEANLSTVGCLPGRPETYPASSAGLRNFTGFPTYSEISNRISTKNLITQQITTGSSNSSTQSYNNTIDVKIGAAGGGNVGVAKVMGGGGVQGGGSWGGGETTIDYSSVIKTGQVAYPPATTSECAFRFLFGTWSVKLGGTDVPVLGYVVNGVRVPPSKPVNLSVETVGADSVTIGWEPGVYPAETYEIYQYFNDGVTDDPYSLVAVVDGSETRFVYDQLNPETSYQLAMRAASVVDGERQVSEMTGIVTATTLSTQEGPIVVGITPEQRVAVHDDAAFVVEARPSAHATSGLTYSWQVREAGKVNWVSAGAGSASRLSLARVDAGMDGNSYRCVVSEIVGGVRRYAYSAVARLYVGVAGSTLAVSATNVDERADNPYRGTNRGLPGSVETRDVETAVPDGANKVLTVVVDGETHQFVEYANLLAATGAPEGSPTPQHVYGEDGGYYVLEGLDEQAQVATACIPLALSHDSFRAEDGSPWNGIAPADLVHTGPQARYETTDAQGDAVSYLVYEFDGQSLFALVDEDAGTTSWYVPGDGGALVPYDGDASGAVPVFLADDETVELGPEDARLAYDSYWPQGRETEGLLAYRLADGSGPWYVMGDDGALVELAVQAGDGFYHSERGGYRALVGDPTLVDLTTTTQQVVVSDGDEVALTVQVASDSTRASYGGNVTFVLYNTTTGTVSSLAAETDATGAATLAWAPSEAGIYEVRATFGGNATLAASTATTTYYAIPADAENLYVLDGQDVVYGNAVELELSRLVDDGAGNLVPEEPAAGTSVSYVVAYEDELGAEQVLELGANHSYTPTVAGPHTFVAHVGASEDGTTQTARVVVNVARRPLVVVAPSKSGLSSGIDDDKVPSLADVVVAYDGEGETVGIVDADQARFAPEALLELSSTPQLTADAPAGVYATQVGLRSDVSTEAFLARYEPRFVAGQYVIEAGLRSVHYTAGSNGEVRGYQGDDLRRFDSGAALVEGARVTLVAVPDDGFAVASWSVADTAGTVLVEGTDYQLNAAGDQVVFERLTDNLVVRATFEPATSQLTFGTGGGRGTVRGAYDSPEATAIVSPEVVPLGRGVRLEAVPEVGFVVSRWTIARAGGAAITYTDELGVYSGTTLTLPKLDGDTTVLAYFDEERFYDVATSVVDQDGLPAAGCTVRVDGLHESGQARRGERLTFVAEVPDNVVVKEWRLYTSDTDYQVVAGGTDSYVVGSVQADLRLCVEVAPFKRFKLHYRAVADDGAEPADVLAASSRGVPVGDGQACVAYVPIDFSVANLPEAYQVARWGVRKGAAGSEQIEAAGADETSFALASLDDETWVTLYLETRPTFVYRAGAHGQLRCEELASGSRLRRGRMDDLVLVAKPDYGYEVDEVRIEGSYGGLLESPVVGSDAQELAVQAPEGGFATDVTVVVSFREIPHIELAYALYDDGLGTHGSIEAAATRHGDERYALDGAASTAGGSFATVYRDSEVVVSADAEVGYGLLSWRVDGREVLGASEALPSYVHLGETDDTIALVVNDELLAALRDGDGGLRPLLVEGQLLINGSVITFGTWGNVGGVVVATDAQGAPVEYGTIYSAAERLTFEVRPEPGCVVVGWRVNGELVDGTDATLSLTVDAEQAYDVRAVVTEPLPVARHTLAFGAVGDEEAAHGSVRATVSVLPGAPEPGYVSTNEYRLGDELASGASVEEGTGVAFVAQAEAGFTVEGWYADAACTVPLAGSAAERTDYELASIERDEAVYVRFVPVATYEVEIVCNGTGAGGFEVYVDGTLLGADELTPTVEGVAAAVPRHSAVEVVAKPADEFVRVSAWNGEQSDAASFRIDDVVAATRITLTLSPLNTVDVTFASCADSAGARVWLLPEAQGEPKVALAAVGRTVRIVSGQSLRFEVVPTAGKMVDFWRVTYANGSVTEGATLGIDNQIVLEDVLLSPVVEVFMRDIVAYRLPADPAPGSGYGIVERSVFPDTLVGAAYANMVREEGTASMRVVPDEGYEIVSIANANGDLEAGQSLTSIVACDDGSYLVEVRNVYADIDLEVEAVPRCVVTIEPHAFGSVQVTDDQGRSIASGDWVLAGTTLRVKAQANPSCAFEGWEDPLAGAPASTTYVVGDDVTFAARFYETRLLTIATSTAGTVRVTDEAGAEVTSGTTLPRGTRLHVEAQVADSNCFFEGWGSPLSGTATQLDLTLDTDLRIQGKFYRTYVVKIGTHSLGSVAVTDASGKAVKSGTRLREGTKLTVQAKPASYCQFAWWSSPLVGKAAKCTYAVAGNVTLSANFVRLPINAKAVATSNTAATVSWTKVNQVDRYVVYLGVCDGKSTIKQYKTVGSGTTSLKVGKLSASKCYKFKVVAQRKTKSGYENASTSLVQHFVTKGHKKLTNAASLSVKSPNVSIAVKKTSKISATLKLVATKKKVVGHTSRLRYRSSNNSVATVSASGVITGKRAGMCTVYVIAECGVWTPVNVTVK